MLQIVAFKNGEKHQKIVMPFFIQKLILSLDDLPTEDKGNIFYQNLFLKIFEIIFFFLNLDMKVVYNLSTGFVTTKGIQISGIKMDTFKLEDKLQFKLECSNFISHVSEFQVFLIASVIFPKLEGHKIS